VFLQESEALAFERLSSLAVGAPLDGVSHGRHGGRLGMSSFLRMCASSRWFFWGLEKNSRVLQQQAMEMSGTRPAGASDRRREERNAILLEEVADQLLNSRFRNLYRQILINGLIGNMELVRAPYTLLSHLPPSSSTTI